MYGNLKGFAVVTLGLAIALLITALSLTSYRGAKLYLSEYKEFKGALSRARGGDWVAPPPTPAAYYPDQVYVDGMEPEQLSLNMPTKGLKELKKAIDRELTTRVN